MVVSSQMMTRTEHLEWCKQRALAYLDAGKIDLAMSSMLSDMSKHPENATNAALQLMFQLRMGGHLDTAEKMRKFILGFN